MLNGKLSALRWVLGDDWDMQARQDFSRKLKWIRPILAAKNDLAVNACGGPRSSSVRHDTQLRVARCAPWLP
jgi:hypothetical protein